MSNQSPKVIFPAVVENVTTRRDKTLKITLGTSNELKAEQMTGMFSLHNVEGWVCLSVDEISEEEALELPEIPVKPGKSKAKSQSQRLRAVLYRLWQEKGEPMGPFDSHFYPTMMEKIIGHYKNELEELK